MSWRALTSIQFLYKNITIHLNLPIQQEQPQSGFHIVVVIVIFHCSRSKVNICEVTKGTNAFSAAGAALPWFCLLKDPTKTFSGKQSQGGVGGVNYLGIKKL